MLRSAFPVLPAPRRERNAAQPAAQQPVQHYNLSMLPVHHPRAMRMELGAAGITLPSRAGRPCAAGRGALPVDCAVLRGVHAVLAAGSRAAAAASGGAARAVVGADTAHAQAGAASSSRGRWCCRAGCSTSRSPCGRLTGAAAAGGGSAW